MYNEKIESQELANKVFAVHITHVCVNGFRKLNNIRKTSLSTCRKKKEIYVYIRVVITFSLYTCCRDTK
jgi:hypothetical protein